MPNASDLVVTAELQAAASEHVALICRLERLADCDGSSSTRRDQRRADRITVTPGHVVLVRGHGRWRYGVAINVDRFDLRSGSITTAYLMPSALDRAQRTWISQSRLLLDPAYPARAASEARQAAEDASSADLAASEAFKDAVFFQAVAAGCSRRPWAALVAPRRLIRPVHEVYKADNQRIGLDSQCWT